MAEVHGSTQVGVAPDALFRYLSRIDNLPDYFDSMTDARPGDEADHVIVTADVEGRSVTGPAEFRIDEMARRIEWGSEGPNDYHGWLAISARGDASEVEVHLSTRREGEANGIHEGIANTLARIRDLVEEAGD